MSGTRRTTAMGAAAFLLASSAALATPAPASAETIDASCGETVTAKPGDQIRTPLGLKTVTEGLEEIVGGLLTGLCKVTVNVVTPVVEQVPAVGGPAAKAVQGATGAVRDTTRQLTGGSPGPAPKDPGPKPPPEESGGPGPGAGDRSRDGGPESRHPSGPAPNSPLLYRGGASVPGLAYLPTDFRTGFAPMRDYSGIPMATAGLFTPSPGVRYGGQIPGYSPEFGILGENGPGGDPRSGVQNAGRAEALPSGPGMAGSDGATLPMLIAVLALSGVTAALVRTWVLRRATA